MFEFFQSYIALLIIMCILRTIFKVDKSITFCGIFAFSGLKGITLEQIRVAVLKIKVLGIYNESRGGQGTGVFINNEIIKCADKTKTFPELIENNLLIEPNNNNIIVGHCRRMSKGAVSYENTHPFLIQEDLVGVKL